MSSSVIDLTKFVKGDLEKARRGKPGTGRSVAGWNATPEGKDHPKDARGRWTDNPVGQAIAQAYSTVRGRHAERGNPWVGLADLREEMGSQFTREQVDAELVRLGQGGGDPDVTITPEENQKVLTQRDRVAAVLFGGEPSHVISIQGKLPAPTGKPKAPKRSGEGNDNAAAMRAFGGHVDFGLGQLGGLVADRRARVKTELPGELREVSKDLGDWDDKQLADVQAAAMDFSRAVEMELFRRKTDAANPPKAPAKPRKATARLTAKPKPDLPSVAARMRQAGSREEATEALQGLTVADLRDVARETGASIGSRMTKAQLQNALVEHLAGGWLDIEALERVDWPSDRERLMSGRSEPPAGQSGVPWPQALVGRPEDWNDEDLEGAANVMGNEVRRLQEVADELFRHLSAKYRESLPKQWLEHDQNALNEARAAVGRAGEQKQMVSAAVRAAKKAKREGGTARPAPAPSAAKPIDLLMRPGITREEIEAELAGKTVAELRALANELHERTSTVPTRSRKKDDIKNDILMGLVGYRERSQAIGGGRDIWGTGKA